MGSHSLEPQMTLYRRPSLSFSLSFSLSLLEHSVFSVNRCDVKCEVFLFFTIFFLFNNKNTNTTSHQQHRQPELRITYKKLKRGKRTEKPAIMSILCQLPTAKCFLKTVTPPPQLYARVKKRRSPHS